jgi:hypothetical protein
MSLATRIANSRQSATRRDGAEPCETAMYRLLTTTLLAALLCLSGCAGNYKSSDDDYRPLGDPQAEQRAQ